MRDDVKKHISEIAELLMVEYNPCHIDGNSCLAGSPIPCCQAPYFDDSKPCPYLNDCRKHKTLTCQIWFCRTALEAMDERCKTAFYALEVLAKAFDLVEPPHLGQGYIGDEKY